MTGAMTGGMPRFEGVIADRQNLPVFERKWFGTGFNVDAKKRAAAARFVEFKVGGMQVNGRFFGQGVDQIGNTANMIEVGMGQPNRFDLPTMFGGSLGDQASIPSRVNDDGFLRVRVGDDIRVGLDGPEDEGDNFYGHRDQVIGN